MTVCKQCNELYDGINEICYDCHWENERVEACGYMLEDEKPATDESEGVR